MRVRLAAQVVSDTVGKVLNEFGPPEAAGTAQFCLMMDNFFDCLNVSNRKEWQEKQKDFLKPEGLQITVHSFKEVCKFLLEHGVPYLLSERFCQDDLENYFGR